MARYGSKSLAVSMLLLSGFFSEGLGNELVLSSGLIKLTEAEMDKYHGGFEAPGGLEINFGLSLFSSVTPIGEQAPLGQNGVPDLIATATLGSGNVDRAIGSAIQYSPNGAALVIQNSLNDVTVQVVSQLNVDVTNYSQLHGQLAILGQTLLNNVSGLPH